MVNFSQNEETFVLVFAGLLKCRIVLPVGCIRSDADVGYIKTVVDVGFQWVPK